MYSIVGMEEPRGPSREAVSQVGSVETDGDGRDEARRRRGEARQAGKDRHSRMCLKGGQRRHLLSQGHQIIWNLYKKSLPEGQGGEDNNK